MLEGCTRIRQRRVGAWPPLRKACACWQGSFECPGGVGAHRGLGHDHVRGETVGNMVTSGRGRCLMRWRHPSQENQRMAQVGIPRWCSAWPRSLVDKTLAWRAPKGSADGAPPRSHPPSGLPARPPARGELRRGTRPAARNYWYTSETCHGHGHATVHGARSTVRARPARRRRRVHSCTYGTRSRLAPKCHSPKCQDTHTGSKGGPHIWNVKGRDSPTPQAMMRHHLGPAC